MNQRRATTGNDTFFHSSFSSVEGVFDPQFAVFEFRFRGRTDLNHCHAASKFGNAFLQFFLIVIRVRFFQLPANLANTFFHVRLSFPTCDNCGGVFIDRHFAGSSQHVQIDSVQRQTHFFGNHLTSREHGNVLQHLLAAIAKSRCFDRCCIEDPPSFIHHQGCQGLPFQIFSDNQQGLTRTGHFLQHWHQVLDGANFLIDDQQACILELCHHCFIVGNEVRRDVTAIELHPLDHFQFRGQGLGLFYRDHPVFGDLVHGLGDHLPYFRIVASRDRRHLGDRPSFYWLRHLLNFLHQMGDCFLNPPAHRHRISPCGHILQPFLDHRLGQHRRRGRAITSDVLSFRCHFPHQLGTGIFQGICQFDLLSNRDAIVNDLGCAKLLLQQHVAPLRSQGNAHGVRQGVDPPF